MSLCLWTVPSCASKVLVSLPVIQRLIPPATDRRLAKHTGMAAFDGPFFSHTAGYSPDQMIEAHDHLDAIIDELGPFGGILGFSQGGALALSYLHGKQSQNEVQPFKFALIMSSVIPCSADASECEDVIQSLCARELSETHFPPVDHDQRLFAELLDRTVREARRNNALLPDIDLSVYDAGGDPSLAPRVMHPSFVKKKIWIPTVHVTGKKDYGFMRAMSDVAHAVCEPKLAKQLVHGGGHQPPQKPAEVREVIRAMGWAIGLSDRFAHWNL
ncbi:serine hydrolase-domain-containing protein [Triangularia setosa]|uniref:Serine hydrolase-domain-containing protein n=1 Tax=Triangularia setosa TaxID=2587417 RepID=A0AAN6WCD8_9PEZI|nr:serine hydrolase-domain-containing protein [Podospora setosa]